MLTLENFTNHWEKKFPALHLKNTKFLIAISGGVDSIVLAHLMYAVKANLSLAHVNFQLRGEESKRDEQFVIDFANRLQIPFKVNRFETAPTR